jgi:hypothetical protein
VVAAAVAAAGVLLVAGFLPARPRPEQAQAGPAAAPDRPTAAGAHAAIPGAPASPGAPAEDRASAPEPPLA